MHLIKNNKQMDWITGFLKRVYELFSFRNQKNRIRNLSSIKLLLAITAFPVILTMLGITLSITCLVTLVGRICERVSDNIKGYY